MKITSSMTALMLTGMAGGATGYAIAQGMLQLTNPVGTELVTVYPLSPTGQLTAAQVQLPLNMIRNAAGYQVISTATLASGTISVSTSTDELLLNVQPNTVTWVLPAKGVAFDAEQFQLCNATNAAFGTNTMLVIAGTSTTINGGSITATSMTTSSCVELVFSNATSTWYRIR